MDYEGRHRIQQEASQVAYPWRATLRTFIQTGVPTILALGVVIPEIIEIVLDGYGETMPPQIRVWLLSATAAIVAGSSVLARIMALPTVNDWLEKVNLSAEPKDQP